MPARALAIVLALLGIAFAAFVEYGTARAADVERSFALFIFEAGPWAVLLVLSLASPYVRILAAVGVVLLALDLYAYYAVFVAAQGELAAVIYLYKPFYGLALIAVSMLAAFLLSRPKLPKE
jgi:hypothetical protein